MNKNYFKVPFLLVWIPLNLLIAVYFTYLGRSPYAADETNGISKTSIYVISSLWQLSFLEYHSTISYNDFLLSIIDNANLIEIKLNKKRNKIVQLPETFQTASLWKTLPDNDSQCKFVKDSLVKLKDEAEQQKIRSLRNSVQFLLRAFQSFREIEEWILNDYIRPVKEKGLFNCKLMLCTVFPNGDYNEEPEERIFYEKRESFFSYRILKTEILTNE